MKVLVVSDTHGYIDDVLGYIKNNDKIDLILHAGDFSKDAYNIEDITGIKTLCVRGNNDYFDSKSPDLRIVSILKHRILLVHGHNEKVYYTKDLLISKCLGNECEMVIFGHTHTYFKKYDDDFNVTLLNPGSASLPRDMIKSFVILDINEKIKITKINIIKDIK